MKTPTWLWPNNKKIAVCFNVCLEAWSDGKAPGISPMGNPLPPGVLDNTAISWAEYGPRRGIYRLLDGFARHGAKASVMTNAIAGLGFALVPRYLIEQEWARTTDDVLWRRSKLGLRFAPDQVAALAEIGRAHV